MSTFHRQRLFSGIRDSHQVPVQSDWAYAIRKQARLILLPLFREVIVTWKEGKNGKRPYLTELAVELYQGFFQNGTVRMSVHSEVEKIISKFLDTLNKDELDVLGFYYLSNQTEVDNFYQEILEREESEQITTDKEDQEVGKVFQNCFKHLNKDYLMGFLMEELGETENVFSNLEVEEVTLDTQSIILINEAFSDYLDIPYGEISLIQKPGEEWDYWERVYEEERKTIGKKLAHDQHKEWLECWLLPDGDFKVKGDLEFPEDSDHAAKTWVQEELQDILVQLETRLIESYSLEEQDIKYTFFTKWEDIKNCDLVNGIAFFADQIDRFGAYDLQLGIKFYLVSEIQKDHQIWSARTCFDFDKRLFNLEDQMDPVSAWVVTIEEMIFQLEAELSMMEKEKVIDALFNKINEDYLKQYGD